MKPAIELLFLDPSEDPRHTAVPRPSGIIAITEKEDHLMDLVRVIDQAFLKGANTDLVACPTAALGVLQAVNEKDQPLLTDAHWSAYAREAGLDMTPDGELRARVLAFYRNGRREAP